VRGEITIDSRMTVIDTSSVMLQNGASPPPPTVGDGRPQPSLASAALYSKPAY
jgi:hypothetical protein